MKRILFVNGTYNDIPLVEAAHRLGYYVITSGNDPTGEAHAYSDEYCPCDYSDKEALLALAREKNVDAVCSCGNDLCATSTSYVCDVLGLPGHDTYEVSKVFHEKDEFKKVVKELGLTSPLSDLFDDEEKATESLEGMTFPKIIKPVDMGGGKGVSVANDIEEARESVKLAFQKSKNKHIVIEDYISGTQHGFICYIKDRKVVFDYSTNDYSYLNPFMVWIGSGYPADDYNLVRNQIIEDVEKMSEQLNVADGFLTIQYMMSGGKAYYLETMRRCIGNLHFDAISRDVGINLYDLYVKTECGMDCSELIDLIHPTGLRSGFAGIYADHNGRYKDAIIDEEFEKCVYKKLMLEEPGYEITDYLGDKLGNLWFSFDSEEQREYFMKRRECLIKVIVE